MSVRAVLAFLIVLATAGPALAQQDPLQRAQTLFDEAQQHYLTKDYAGAADRFKQAFDARPLPSFLYNAAAAHHMQG